MNFEKLKQLPTDVLLSLQSAINDEIDSRMDFSVAVGRECTFIDSSKGIERFCTVERILRTNVVVIESYDSHSPGQKWRVPKRALTMKGVQIEKPHATVVKAKPTESVEYVGASW